MTDARTAGFAIRTTGSSTRGAWCRANRRTTDKAAVDACGRELAARLTAIGGRVQTLPRERAGDHLLAEFGCGERQVLLLGHFDTVWPVGELARQPWRDGGRTALRPGRLRHEGRARPGDARRAGAAGEPRRAARPRDVSLDQRRRDRQRVVPVGHRRRGPSQRRRAGARAVAARRRGEDRRARAAGEFTVRATRRGRPRRRRAREGRQRDSRTGPTRLASSSPGRIRRAA